MTNTADKIHLTPAVLKWARERAGYTAKEAAKLMREKSVTAEFILACEQGEEMMTYPQLEKLAVQVYKRPPLVFFLPQPPQEEMAEENFRTLPQAAKKALPPNIRYMLRRGIYFKYCLNKLYGGKNPAEKKIFAAMPAQKHANIAAMATLAAKTRAHLGIATDEQKGWKSTNEALQQWRNKITDCGIFVFKEPFKDSDYSGFCLHDETFPIIYLNSQMPKQRQIFTIFHELGHILLGTGGVDFRDTAHPLGDNTEQACNRFAADFLVPSDDFERLHGGKTDDDTIKMLARKYKVSKEVILRKFVDQGLINAAQYKGRLERLSARGKATVSKKQLGESASPPAKSAARQSSSGVKMDYLGEKYIRLVLSKQQQAKISNAEAADYLDVKEYDIDNLEDEIGQWQHA